MKQVTAKLVYQNRTQRFYELSEPITKGIRFKDEVNIIEEMQDDCNRRIKEEYRKYVPKDGCHLLCVSDAHTHIERLVFAAFKYLKDGVYEYCPLPTQIDGKHTFMIDGGNINSVYADEVYIRHLGRINGMSISLIKES